jgi:hypothetical protein
MRACVKECLEAIQIRNNDFWWEEDVGEVAKDEDGDEEDLYKLTCDLPQDEIWHTVVWELSVIVGLRTNNYSLVD